MLFKPLPGNIPKRTPRTAAKPLPGKIPKRTLITTTKNVNKALLIIILLLTAVVFLAAVSPTVAAAASGPLSSPPEPYRLKLLAVQETPAGYEGSEAELFLELKPGTGRVFLETFPLTKMDTQISTRFAKEIACKHFKLDCGQHDFIFTIKAQSNIIGGPSAGAAIAALTTIAVLDLSYNENIAITGTINSGGIVGHVGGTREKIDAAARAGIPKVLIAAGAAAYPMEGNVPDGGVQDHGQNRTVNLLEHARELGIEVVEVVDLDDVILQLTGRDLNHQLVEVTEDAAYRSIMQGLQEVLCSRTGKLQQELSERGFLINESSRDLLNSRLESARNASREGDYYSAASFCFSANILLKQQYYEQEGLRRHTAENLFGVLERKIKALEQRLEEQEISTISDLQTAMIVQERLSDARQQLPSGISAGTSGLQPVYDTAADTAAALAYAEERYFSALSWMQFFSMGGKKIQVDRSLLEEACVQKISEAEERHQYTSLFLGEFRIQHIREKIREAQQANSAGEYELCLITSSQAKADANAILSSLGLTEQSVPDFLASKRQAVERVIAENSAEGVFPILGYSYYQYAKSLEGTEPFTALVYYEYALEMGDLGMYFPAERQFLALPGNGKLAEKWWYAIIGILVGLLLGYAFGAQKQASEGIRGRSHRK